MVLFYQFIFTILITLASIKISKKISLIDFPVGRKKHSSPTVLAGGLSICISILFALKFGEFDDYYLNAIIGYAVLIALIGIADDKYSLNVGSKLALMTFAIFFLIKDGLTIDTLGTYDFFGEIKLGSLQIAFTFISVLLLINAFNYSDGIDGNCIGLFLSGLFLLLYLNTEAKDLINFIYHLAIIVTTVLYFNLSKNKSLKLFLGDGGSLMLGFISAFLLIYCYKVLNNHPSDLIWCFNIIIFDFFAVNAQRFEKNKNIFTPGDDHIHHILSRKYKSKLIAFLLILFFNSAFGILGITLSKQSNILSILSFTILFFIYYYFRHFLTKKIK
tara:strand:+ start:541 stop:1533 length:993 start_codon:yes stop_codon:yes gene_type:complete